MIGVGNDAGSPRWLKVAAQLPRILVVLLGTFLAVVPSRSRAASDWPMWRYDAGRTAASPDPLPERLSLVWTLELGPRQPVWDDPLNQDLMPYDRVFEPVILGGRLVVGFNDRDKVVAYDLSTGRPVWTVYTDGPVRLPPAGWEGKVYFTSDDGCLYCVQVEDGKLLWKFRGGPSDRTVLGNRRLISAWPARGGPVVRDGVVYFAASIWPFMGTFLYALDAGSGEVVWINDRSGAQYHQQPHSAPAFAGVAPQGALALDGSTLLVPGGRSVPAAFDAATGELRHFLLNAGGKGNGGSFVISRNGNFYVHTRYRGVRRFDLASGNKTEVMLNEPVLIEGGLYTATAEAVMALDLQEPSAGPEGDGKAATDSSATAADRNKKFIKWQVPADGSGDLILAGNRVYAAGRESISAISLPVGEQPAGVAWTMPVKGDVVRLLAGGGHLVAVTLDGRIMAYGEVSSNRSSAAKILAEAPAGADPAPEAIAAAERILERSAGAEGYAVFLGADDPTLIEALAARSKLHWIVFDPDADRIEALRRRWDSLGLYGQRLVAKVGGPESIEIPPYIVRLAVIGRDMAGRASIPEALARIHRALRPYGGTICFPRKAVDQERIQSLVRSLESETARCETTAEDLFVIRDGPLPGAAPWTHQYGNVANTVKSNDVLVKAPLGLLWFGGNSNLDILPRHGHGPTPQILGGRIFLQGMSSVSARDVYTGQVLWNRDFGDLGTREIFFDETYKDTPLDPAYNQVHIPGANLRGTNYVATPEGIYLVVGRSCHVLDVVTGATLRVIDLPAAADGRSYDEWGYLGVYEDLLLAGAGFANYSRRLEGVKYEPSGKRGMAWSPDRFGSLGLVAMNRHTGAVEWQVEARHSFLHNGIVAGGGRVYCLDKLPKSVEEQLARRGRSAPDTYRFLALDAASGATVWETSGDAFGTWLGYSSEHDLLLQAGSSASDRSLDEVGQGMAAYRGRDGGEIWRLADLEYAGPCILHGETIITNATSNRVNAGAFHLLTGRPAERVNPVTGQNEPWRFMRTYGCNTAVACENLITFRSGAAGYFDLTQPTGTGNLGGFRAGCTSNLLAADGVLSAPDFTRTCSCGYQNQSSLALVHMPEVESWTLARPDQFTAESSLRRIGVNLGAPGDRQSDEGTLWLEYPNAGGDSPPLEVQMQGKDIAAYCRHSLFVSGDVIPWVVASGVRNVRQLTVKLRGAAQEPEALYSVRLYFSEPGEAAEGERQFDVRLQGKKAAEKIDVRRQAGGALKGIVLRFDDIPVTDLLKVELEPAGGSRFGPVLAGIECIEQQAVVLGARQTLQ